MKAAVIEKNYFTKKEKNQNRLYFHVNFKFVFKGKNIQRIPVF